MNRVYGDVVFTIFLSDWLSSCFLQCAHCFVKIW